MIADKHRKLHQRLLPATLAAALTLSFYCPLMAQEPQLPLRGLEPGEAVMQQDIVPVDDLSDGPDPQRIQIIKPPLSALISIEKGVDPLLLDASGSTSMSLDDVVHSAVRNNLDIGISDFNRRVRKANMLSSMGKFLPDINLAYQWNYLNGKANVPFGQSPEPLKFNNPFILTSAGFKYYGYRGGSVLFGALQNRNNFRAARHASHATIADTLQKCAKYYYDLLLQEAILQIRVKAVETSVGQLTLNRDLRQGGLATNLEVLQAETQLSQDRQNLIDQQVARREAAITLSEFLNDNQGVDIVPKDLLLQKIRIVATSADPARLLQLAVDNRPELKQYEELRLAAKKQIVINSAKLQPSVALSGNVLGIGETLGRHTKLVPITLAGVTSGGTAGTVTTNLVPRQRQITALYTIGVNVNWNFEGLGTVDAANIYAAKLTARQAVLQQNQVLNRVTGQVRRSYLRALQTDRKIDEAVAQVRSANEELRLAQLRFQNGVGRNIDVLKAQQDYTSSLIEKARALVNFNNAQIDLLHDTGLISMNTLLSKTPAVK